MAHRFTVRMLCLSICMVLMLLLMGIYIFGNSREATAEDFSVESNDSEIDVSWNTDNISLTDTIIISISDNSTCLEVDEISAVCGGYKYSDGEHGALYNIGISIRRNDGKEYNVTSVNRMFLDYEQLPDMPILNISTFDGKEPTYDVVEKPSDELWGASIINNDYVSGVLEFHSNGQKDLSSVIKIKYRGNTSSLGEKKCYKIKLSNELDLLQNNSKGSKEWVLLNSGTNLNFYIGNFVGRECGMEWNPDAIFVNVIFNGDWKGIYYLTESVGRESGSDYVSDDGFIIENDGYFWKEDEIYFKTSSQRKQMGYTFKYPKVESESDPVFQDIQDYMQLVEDSIIDNSDYLNYIDAESFSKWLLARDLMGTYDGGGANQYYYKYSLSGSDSKLKMGPLWDWDCIYNGYTWSACRGCSYGTNLLQDEYFSELYKTEYTNVAQNLLTDLNQMFAELEKSEEDLNESWKLDASRWNTQYTSLEEKEEQVIGWFNRRIPWMNRYLYYVFTNPSEIVNTEDFSYVNGELPIYIDMYAQIDGWLDFYGIYTDVNQLLNDNCEIGYISQDGTVYLSVECSSDDSLEDKYPSENKQLTFDILVDNDYGQFCLIDFDNKVIYREELTMIDMTTETEYEYSEIGEPASAVELSIYNNGVRMVSGWLYAEGINTDGEGMYIGYDVEGKLYLSEPIARTDIQEKYNYDVLYTGFLIKHLGKGKLCVVDTVNKKVYEVTE